MDQKPAPAINMPSAIIISAAIIAVALIWINKPATTNTDAQGAAAIQAGQATQGNIPEVTASDHIYGNPSAKVKIVEYSDPSCPFCKLFHPTMQKIMAEYGPSGNVAWVYRHFPLDTPDAEGFVLHPNAGHEAQAMECAAQVGGNDKFWAFTNMLYDITPAVTPETPKGLDQAKLPQIAKDIGLDVVAFNECLSSGQTKSRVQKNYLDALNAGIQGTPYSVIITPTGSKVPLIGAQQYSTIKAGLDALLGAN